MRAFVSEISAVRAFAVLAVVGFHAFPDLVPSGQIGVDIFFVVSGYVISRTYLHRLTTNKTKLTDFFIRRIRRLAPAYLLVLMLTLPIAVIILDPVQLEKFAASLLAQPFYLQNIVFWNQGDYFFGAWTKPLLHTWSLAVEEQFYLTFALLVIIARYRRSLGAVVLVAAFILSLASGYLMTFVSERTAFFWLPFRAWEFIAGILVYLLASRFTPRRGGWPVMVAFVVAVSGLFISVLGFAKESIFPGPQAFLAVASTVALLVMFELRTIAPFKVLNYSGVRYIGDVSYSLYLWHWPVLSFAMILMGPSLSSGHAMTALLLSFVLAIASYHFVENPIRIYSLAPMNKLLLGRVAFLSGCIISLSAIVIMTHGALFRFPEPLRTLYETTQQSSNARCSRTWRIVNSRSELCPVNSAARKIKPAVLILGDSHAAQWHKPLGSFGDEVDVGVYLAARYCDFDEYGTRRICSDEVFERIIAQAKRANVRKFVLISKWPSSGPRKKEVFHANLRKVMEAGFDIAISETVPVSVLLNPYQQAKRIRLGHGHFESFTMDDYIRSNEDQREFFRAVEQEFASHIQIIRPANELCKTGICEFYTNGKPNYVDSSHISEVGAARLMPRYSTALKLTEPSSVVNDARRGK